MKRLPPLKALHSFESAARHLSFSKAADELFVTPGAISQQIKLLEEFLGVSLFKRMHRRILLTDEGQSLLPGIQGGFESFVTAINDVKAIDPNKPITISTTHSFASRWLVPRLGMLREEYPDINIRLDTSFEVVDLVNSDIDIGIRFGSGDYPGMEVDLLLCQEVFPVCSAKFLKRSRIKKPEDLNHQHLLHFNTTSWDSHSGWPDWQMWLRAAGIDNVDTRNGLIFDQQDTLIQSALNGQGVALVGSVAVIDDIKSGRLVKPFDVSFPLQFSYYFVTSPTKARWPNIEAIRQWLQKEIAVHHSPIC